jgi:hypothetical protein
VRGGAAVGGEADNGKHVGLERVEDGKDRVVDLECLDPLRALGAEENFLFLECRQSGQHGAGRAGDTWEANKTHLGTTLLDALALAFLEKLEQVILPRRVEQLYRKRHSLSRGLQGGYGGRAVLIDSGKGMLFGWVLCVDVEGRWKLYNPLTGSNIYT